MKVEKPELLEMPADAPVAPAERLERVRRHLAGAKYTFAKTMKYAPHHYTLRKHWVDDEDYVDAVLFIREYGVKER